MKMPLRICFIAEDFYPGIIGGQGMYGRHLVEELSRMGHRVTVFLEHREGRRKYWKRTKNVMLIEVPKTFGNKLLLSIFILISYYVHCRKTNFDIVHTNGVSGALLTLFRPKQVRAFVTMDHNTNYEMAKQTHSFVKKIFYPVYIFFERMLFERSDGVLFNNPLEEKNVKTYYRISQKPTASVFLGTTQILMTKTEEEKIRNDIRGKLSIPRSAKIVLYVGRLVARKNVDLLIEALNELSHNDPSIYGLIVGDGPERQSLKKMANKYVRFVGFSNDPMPYYLASDLFVTVSVAEGGFLLTALEAAKCGLPLLLSPDGSGFPIIKEGVNGYRIKPSDDDALVRKIRYLLRRRDTMGRKSMMLAKQFTWDRCARKTMEFYQEVLGRLKNET